MGGIYWLNCGTAFERGVCGVGGVVLMTGPLGDFAYSRMDEHEDLTGRIIGAAMRVHAVLGPGMLERAYQLCLAHELRKRGLSVRTEVPVSLVYDGIDLDLAYRLDIVVEESAAVEVKAISNVLPVHKAQLLSQLRVAKLRVGLLLNFHNESLKNGIHRVANTR